MGLQCAAVLWYLNYGMGRLTLIGSVANLAAYVGVLQPGDTLMGLALASGGQYALSSLLLTA